VAKQARKKERIRMERRMKERKKGGWVGRLLLLLT
jgi:hypothetical protein